MLTEVYRIAVIAGTIRERRESIKAARYVADFGRQLPSVSITFVDPKDFVLSGDGNDPECKNPRYSQITQEADAFFIVTPEYNHSFPGSLKRLLDSELEHYHHKPVAFAGVSNNMLGGALAIEALVTSVREMGLVATSYSVYFSRVQDIFSTQGVIRPEQKEKYDRALAYAYEELLWMAKALRWGREAV